MAPSIVKVLFDLKWINNLTPNMAHLEIKYDISHRMQ